MNRRIALFKKPGLTNYSKKVLGVSRANLLVYFPLNGNALDYSGNGFNGVVSNVIYGAGIGDGGKAAIFAGTGYINFFSAAFAAVFNGAEGTVSVWQCVSAAGDWSDSAYRDVLIINKDANNMIQLTKGSAANRYTFDRIAAATAEARNQAIGPSTAMFHTAMTWSEAADQVIYYLAGTPLETDTTLGAWGTAVAVRALIGASTTTPGSTWKGNIAHFGLWNTPLLGTQIASLAVV